MPKTTPFDPVLHSKLWTIAKHFHDHPDGSYEEIGVETLTELFAEHAHTLTESVLEELSKKLPIHEHQPDCNSVLSPQDDICTCGELAFNQGVGTAISAIQQQLQALREGKK